MSYSSLRTEPIGICRLVGMSSASRCGFVGVMASSVRGEQRTGIGRLVEMEIKWDELMAARRTPKTDDELDAEIANELGNAAKSANAIKACMRAILEIDPDALERHGCPIKR